MENNFNELSEMFKKRNEELEKEKKNTEKI